MKIADIEIVELQNIPVTPPLFKQPVRAAVRLLKVKTDDGLRKRPSTVLRTCFHGNDDRTAANSSLSI